MKKPYFLFFRCKNCSNYFNDKFVGLIDSDFSEKTVLDQQLQIDYGSGQSITHLLSLFCKSVRRIKKNDLKYIDTSFLTIVAYLFERKRKTHIFSFSNKVICYLDLFHTSLDFDYYYNQNPSATNVKFYDMTNIKRNNNSYLFSNIKIIIRLKPIKMDINLILQLRSHFQNNVAVSKHHGAIQFTFVYKTIKTLDIQILKKSVFYIFETICNGEMNFYFTNPSMDISFICYLGYNKIYLELTPEFWSLMSQTNSKLKIHLHTDF